MHLRCLQQHEEGSHVDREQTVMLDPRSVPQNWLSNTEYLIGFFQMTKECIVPARYSMSLCVLCVSATLGLILYLGA